MQIAKPKFFFLLKKMKGELGFFIIIILFPKRSSENSTLHQNCSLLETNNMFIRTFCCSLRSRLFFYTGNSICMERFFTIYKQTFSFRLQRELALDARTGVKCQTSYVSQYQPEKIAIYISLK